MKKLSIRVRSKALVALTSISILTIGCNDRIDVRGTHTVEGEIVPITLSISLADKDGGNIHEKTAPVSPATKVSSTKAEAFQLAISTALATKAGEVVPDHLYNVEIVQYDRSGTYKARKYIGGATDIGSSLDAELQTLTDCQLVIVAWGNNVSTTLGTDNLSAAQKKTVDPSVIEKLDPAKQDDMNKMPYVLHLPHVNVTKSGSVGIISSPEGEDVRLRLKRLAVRLTFDWTYSVSNYFPQQILIYSVPFDYKVIAAPDASDDNTYPSLLDQYTTIKVPESQIAASGSFSWWMPANVRGTNPAATSLFYRTKANAPVGSTYVSFLSVMNGDTNKKKKLDYRIYLGENETSDFNLYGNTDYTYKARFAHTQLPVNDGRVTIIDPILASEYNNAFVPTGNCFMVSPGGSFCFNPYKYYVKGAVSNNTLLQKWCQSTKIKSVKVLWQTKENGDVGDPVLGIVSSVTDHTNIVELKNGDDFANARIYCHVAPNTTGGSGLIAAYDDENGTGNVLWSWHIWVTTYAPSETADETILSPENKRILKLSRNGVSYKPMMDRCLGAYDGYVEVPNSIVNMSRANGLHYQRARKDPFSGSYPSEELPNQYKFSISTGRPPKNCLNRYEPDGVAWVIPEGLNMTSVHHAYQHPEAIGQPQSQEWSTNPESDPDGRPAWSNNKTMHDPCPAGWRVPTTSELQILIDYNAASWTSIVENSKADGGALLQYDATANRTYMRFSGYPANSTTLNNVGYTIFLATTASAAKSNSVFITSRTGGIIESGGGIKFATKDNGDAQNIRCIQDR